MEHMELMELRQREKRVESGKWTRMGMEVGWRNGDGRGGRGRNRKRKRRQTDPCRRAGVTVGSESWVGSDVSA
jgi:hypothetical protein